MKLPVEFYLSFPTNYDFESIMHYWWGAFGIECDPGDDDCFERYWMWNNNTYVLALKPCESVPCRRITIEVNNDDSNLTQTAALGQDDHLSDIDIAKANYLYPMLRFSTPCDIPADLNSGAQVDCCE